MNKYAAQKRWKARHRGLPQSEKAKEGNRRRNAKWKERHPERVAALNRAKTLRSYYKHHSKNKEAMRMRAEARRKNRTPEQIKARRNYELKKLYGITLAQFDTLLSSQGGVCAGCGGDRGRRQWQVDHCHNSKVVRGILCSKCNTGIGLARDDPKILKRWIKYILPHVT